MALGTIPRLGACSRANDKAIPIAAQDFMIGAIDERAYGPTHTHTLATSHSPFYSQPSALAEILSRMAASANSRADGRETMGA